MGTSMEIAELRTELAKLQEQVATLAAELIVERQISAILRKKTAHCRGCQDRPDAAEGQPPITELERTFCARPPVQNAVARSIPNAPHLVRRHS